MSEIYESKDPETIAAAQRFIERIKTGIVRQMQTPISPFWLPELSHFDPVKIPQESLDRLYEPDGQIVYPACELG